MMKDPELSYFENLARSGNPFDDLLAEDESRVLGRSLAVLLDLEHSWEVVATAARDAATILNGEGIQPIVWEGRTPAERDDFLITTREALYTTVAMIGDANPAARAGLRRIIATAANADSFQRIITGQEAGR
ncbi:hypothetical protein [Kocuria rhizophila]|uniref:hypothetical protein n=1 Tax=Kocuria rhizophila TaxID=72000 RepID=UPI000303BE9C|nr:hypothetical protein [Kocuria rhizophila]